MLVEFKAKQLYISITLLLIMTLRKAQEKDFMKLAELYRSFFPVHNLFQGPRKRVVKYLKEQSKENELVVYDDGSLRGALYLLKLGQDASGSHKLWKFRHFAFESKKIASSLLAEAEKRVRKASKYSKIELTVAESEPGFSFYKSKGYKKEGALRHHYRRGETCYVLSKCYSS